MDYIQQIESLRVELSNIEIAIASLERLESLQRGDAVESGRKRPRNRKQ